MFKKVRKYLYYLVHPIIGEVWELHSVTNTFSKDMVIRQYEISPGRLESLIIEYKKKGYEFVSLAEVLDRLKEQKLTQKWRNIFHRFVAITMDDGFKDNYEVAYPIFRKYNIPFCIYIASGFIEQSVFPHNDSAYKALTIEQLKILASDDLCTIGAHTAHHVDLMSLSQAQMREEILDSTKKIESWIGRRVVDFSSPYGSYNNASISILKELGYHTHVASWGGEVRINSSIWSIPRIITEESRIIN